MTKGKNAVADEQHRERLLREAGELIIDGKLVKAPTAEPDSEPDAKEEEQNDG